MIKKLLRYVIILLLLVLGLCAIGLLFLFFIPNSSIFGITYIGEQITANSLEYDINKVHTIELNTNSFKVNVINSDSKNTISVNVFSDTFGYVLKKNSQINITEKLYGDKLTVSITEPHGFAYKNNSNIELRLPKVSNNLNLLLNNHSSNTEINCKESKISSLKYKTNSGNLNLKEASITGAINLDMSSADCYLNSSLKLNNNSVTLKQTSGNFSTSEKSVVGNFYHESNTTGNVYIAECKNYLAPNLGTAGGRIAIDKVTEKVNLNSTDTHISIGEAVGGIIINLTKSGSVQVKTLTENADINNSATINTSSGNISIGTCKKYLNISTKNGNIDIKNMYIAIDAKTVSGSININYAKDAGSYLDKLEASYNRKASIITNRGNVKVTGVDNLNLNITGSGNATIVMREVYGENIIKANNGIVKVTTPSNLNVKDDNLRHKYSINANSEIDGNVCIAVSGVVPIYSCNKWQGNIGLIAGQTEDNLKGSLNVSSSAGEIEIFNVEYTEQVKQQKSAR